ncbi:MAG: tetratricopeptide repeat protein [Planctomycetota bacterium]
MRALFQIVLLASLAACSDADRWPIPPELDGSVHTDEAIQRAVRAAREAVLAAPASIEARLELGKYLAASDLHGQARVAFEQALEIGADDARTHAYLAVSRHGAGDLDAALASIKAARERAADHAPLAWREGLWLLEAGEVDAAFRAFDAATRIDPEDPVGWVGVARAALQRDDAGGALVALERARAVAGGPLARYVDHLAGTALQRLGRTAEAETLFARGEPQDFTPHDPWRAELAAYDVGVQGRMRAARRALRQGRAADAIAILERLVAETQPTRRILDNLVSTYLVANDLENAARVLERYADDPPASANTLYLEAVVGRSAGAPEAEVRGLLARSLELNPRFAPSLGLTASLDAARGDYPSALQHVELALAQGEPELAWLSLAAEAASRLGDWQRAVGHLERATKLAPDDASLTAALATARQRASAVSDR